MPDHAYHLLDVFTDTPFGGNQLAVFPDARGLDAATMQRLARELNLAETTFVFPPTLAGATHHVRIFTPGEEVPFAGHPTIGTAILLTLRETPSAAQRTLVLQEAVGPVSVTVTQADGRWAAELTAARVPERRPGPPAADVAAVLGLEAGDVLEGAAAPAVWSCGLDFTFVRLRSIDALGRALIDQGAWRRHPHFRVAPMFYLYTTETGDPAVQVRARMFAPEIGVPEDPATGSACSALAGPLLAAAPVAEGPVRWTVHQGVEMGRPSVLQLTAEVTGGAIREVRVRGSAVPMADGVFRLP